MPQTAKPSKAEHKLALARKYWNQAQHCGGRKKRETLVRRAEFYKRQAAVLSGSTSAT